MTLPATCNYDDMEKCFNEQSMIGKEQKHRLEMLEKEQKFYSDPQSTMCRLEVLLRFGTELVEVRIRKISSGLEITAGDDKWHLTSLSSPQDFADFLAQFYDPMDYNVERQMDQVVDLFAGRRSEKKRIAGQDYEVRDFYEEGRWYVTLDANLRRTERLASYYTRAKAFRAVIKWAEHLSNLIETHPIQDKIVTFELIPSHDKWYLSVYTLNGTLAVETAGNTFTNALLFKEKYIQEFKEKTCVYHSENFTPTLRNQFLEAHWKLELTLQRLVSSTTRRLAPTGLGRALRLPYPEDTLV